MSPSGATRSNPIVGFLEQLGYGTDLRAHDFPVWTGKRVIDVEVVGFAARPTDMRSSTILGGHLNGVTREDIFEAARALACPAAIVAQMGQYELWSIRGARTGGPERIAATTQDGLGPLAEQFRSSLRPDALLAGKQAIRQMSMFPVDIELLDRARHQTGQSLASIVETAMSTLLQRVEPMATTDEREAAWRSASMLTVSAMAALVVRDKFELAASGQDIFRAAHERFPKQFAAPSAIDPSAQAQVSDLISILGDNINYRGLDPSVISHVYEDAVVHRAVKLELGIYYTPPGLAASIAAAIPFEEIAPEARSVLDPACGSGTLLLAAYDRLSSLAPNGWDSHRRNSFLEAHLRGFDKDPFAAELARLSMFIHALPAGPRWSVSVRDSLDTGLENRDKPSFLITNPPWGDRRRTGQSREQYANRFVEWGLENVQAGGFVAFILPASWLASVSSRASRRSLRERADVFEVWRLPEGVFGSGAMAPAVVLANSKPPSRKTWLYKRVVDTVSMATFVKEGKADLAIVANADVPTTGPFVATSFDTWLASRDSSGVLASRGQVHSSPVVQPPAAKRGGTGPFKWVRYFGSVPAYGSVRVDHTVPIRYPEEFSRRGPGLGDLLRASKVILSGKRTVQSPWRLKVALDEIGVIPRESANFLIPADNTPGERRALVAFLASRFASAWVDAFEPLMAISPDLFATMPTPSSAVTWQSLTRLGSELVTLADAGSGQRTSGELCREIDEIVEVALGLPIDSRRQLDRLFAGRPSPDGSVRYVEEGRQQSPGATEAIVRFGAVLETKPGSLLLWVPGSTPTGGQWMSPPSRFLGWHCAPGATFDVIGPLEDLDAGVFSFQRLSYRVPHSESLARTEPIA